VTVAVKLTGPRSEWTFGSGGVSQAASDIDRILFAARPLENEETKIAELVAGADDPVADGAVSSAISFLYSTFERAIKLGSWSSPLITLSETGEVVFEWWHGNRKITLYFGVGQAEFIKVWGTDIETEMDSGVLTDGWALTSLWLWLHA
jgi:hypothetical protein